MTQRPRQPRRRPPPPELRATGTRTYDFATARNPPPLTVARAFNHSVSPLTADHQLNCLLHTASVLRRIAQEPPRGGVFVPQNESHLDGQSSTATLFLHSITRDQSAGNVLQISGRSDRVRRVDGNKIQTPPTIQRRSTRHRPPFRNFAPASFQEASTSSQFSPQRRTAPQKKPWSILLRLSALRDPDTPIPGGAPCRPRPQRGPPAHRIDDAHTSNSHLPTPRLPSATVTYALPARHTSC